MMHFVEPLANSTTERQVVVRNSAFVGRTFHTDATIYTGRYDCETNGITTPLAKVIVIGENGELIIGDENTPYPESAKIVLHGASGDTGEQSGTGIPVVKNGILNKGLIKIYGDHSRFTEARLTQGIVNGDTVLKVDSDVHGWQVGDEIVIPSSMTDATQVELGTIASVNGDEITLTSPVTNTHKE